MKNILKRSQHPDDGASPGHAGKPAPDVALRPPHQVCTLSRMGAAFPTRLSFMRLLLRRMSAEGWDIQQARFELNAEGHGRAVYRVVTPNTTYSLAAFANPLADEDRTDRVIASAWDAAFVLFDGEPTEDDLDRLEKNAPHQEAGRFQPTDLVISRANRSLRLFKYVCDCLARGEQPEPERLLDVGYLMRTTAVYGNGKFGISDRTRVSSREEAQNSFQLEMLTVYLIRLFTFDQLEHIASARAPGRAVRLHSDLKRSLGIGNATGLGMAPFLVSHPELVHEWFHARESALARVRSKDQIHAADVERAVQLVRRARKHLTQWNLDDERYRERNKRLSMDLETLDAWLGDELLISAQPRLWNTLYERSEEAFGIDGQELLVALLIEVYPDSIEGLDGRFHASEKRLLDATQRVGDFRAWIDERYNWTDRFDFAQKSSNAHFWYVSENKLEPRFGQRFHEPGAEREMPVAIARDMAKLRARLGTYDPQTNLATFLIEHPEFRHLVRRAQALRNCEYGEIQDNLISEGTSPLDILRFKLAFFGAAKFDPKSSLWTRITMFQGAPLPEELATKHADNWWLATLPAMH